MLCHHTDTSLDLKVRMDLNFQLRENSNKIQEQYASYVYDLCECLKKKRVTPDQLCTFVLHQSLPREIKGIEEATTLNKIFNLIGGQCASFFHYDIYQSIQKRFCSNSKLNNYSEHFKNFVNRHKISEFFGINPKLKTMYNVSSEELVLKVGDIEMYDKLIKAVDFQHALAKALDKYPSELQFISVEEGCVLMKFLISAGVKSTLTRLSPQQKEELKELSITYLLCGDFKLDLSHSGEVHSMCVFRICSHTSIARRKWFCPPHC
jgi:hypothetical protein